MQTVKVHQKVHPGRSYLFRDGEALQWPQPAETPALTHATISFTLRHPGEGLVLQKPGRVLGHAGDTAYIEVELTAEETARLDPVPPPYTYSLTAQMPRHHELTLAAGTLEVEGQQRRASE